MKKGRFEKFGPQNKRRNMDQVRCFGCNELGHYKRDFPKYEMKRGKGKNLMQRNLRKKKRGISTMIDIISFK